MASEKQTPVEITSKERPSVMALIKMNEERLKGSTQRSTVNQMYNSSRIEIKEKIRKILEEYNRDTNVLDLDRDEFMKDKLRGLGIHERDFKELVDFYNKVGVTGRKTAERKERNTVGGFVKKNGLGIPSIKEVDEKSDKGVNRSRDSIHYDDIQPDLVKQMDNRDSGHDNNDMREGGRYNGLSIVNSTQYENSKVGETNADYICYNDSDNYKRKGRNSNNGVPVGGDAFGTFGSGGVGNTEGGKRSNKQVYEYSNSSNEINPVNKAKNAARAILKELNENNQSDTTANNTGIQSPTVLNVNTQSTSLLSSERKSIHERRSAERKSSTRENKLKEYIDSKNSILTGRSGNTDKPVDKKQALIEKENLGHKDGRTSSGPEQNKYQKNIILSLDNIAVIQYTINPNLPLDPMFFDILCINCYECVRPTEVDQHSQFCIIQPDDYNDLNIRNESEEDYNARIYKLHESLKKKKFEITTQQNNNLTEVFNELLTYVYEILMNNYVKKL
jgi:hypothetical protein